MVSAKRLLIGLALFMAGQLQAAMDIAPPVNIKWNGFIQAWESLAESGNSVPKGPDYNQSGAMLKRFRIKMTAEAYDGLTVVLLPELAGSSGFFLLDGYIQADLDKYLVDFSLPISVTMGQFKTPFGLNRMYTPAQLAFVNYSSISNAVFGSSNFWDDGLMLTYKIPKMLKLDLAVVEGLGPNQATPASYAFAGGSQDYVGRLEYMPLEYLTVGGSFYHGEYFTGNGGTQEFPIGGKDNPRLWSSAFMQLKFWGKSLQVDLEMINRGVDRGGFSGVASYYIFDSLQAALGYDRLEVYGNDKAAATRYQLGLNWWPGGPLKLGLNEEASAAGTDQSLRPGSASKTVLQAQVNW